MLNEKEFYIESLRDHLYYLRTIRNFCITMELSFYKNNLKYIEICIDFANLTEKYLKNNNNDLSIETEKIVLNYKLFVSDIIDRLLRDEVYFIIPPTTLDNFLTNINVYLYIIKYVRQFK